MNTASRRRRYARTVFSMAPSTAPVRSALAYNRSRAPAPTLRPSREGGLPQHNGPSWPAVGVIISNGLPYGMSKASVGLLSTTIPTSP